MSRLIVRDPFARMELHRAIDRSGSCPECGQPGRYRYHVESDGGRRYDDRTPLAGIRRSGPFCSVGCYRSYNA